MREGEREGGREGGSEEGKEEVSCITVYSQWIKIKGDFFVCVSEKGYVFTSHARGTNSQYNSNFKSPRSVCRVTDCTGEDANTTS